MKKTRIGFYIIFLTFAFIPGLFSRTYRDLANREVKIEKEIQRVILAEGRLIYMMGILDKEDPFKKIVGIGSDLRICDPNAYEEYFKGREKAKARVKEVGSPYKQDYDLEYISALEAEMILLPLSGYEMTKERGWIDRFERIGLKVFFIDFRLDPIRNTKRSIQLIGSILGYKESSERYIQYYEEKLQMIDDRLERKKKSQGGKLKRPKVFMELGAGLILEDKEYETFSQGNISDLIERAGGDNISSNLVGSGFLVKVSPEFVLEQDPDYMMTTGVNWNNDEPGNRAVHLGYRAKMEDIQSRMRKIIEKRKGWNYLKAIQRKDYYGVYHQFYNSPYHIFLILQLAKWFHPEDFKDIDVSQLFKNFHRDYLPIAYSGHFWAKLQ